MLFLAAILAGVYLLTHLGGSSSESPESSDNTDSTTDEGPTSESGSTTESTPEAAPDSITSFPETDVDNRIASPTIEDVSAMEATESTASNTSIAKPLDRSAAVNNPNLDTLGIMMIGLFVGVVALFLILVLRHKIKDSCSKIGSRIQNWYITAKVKAAEIATGMWNQTKKGTQKVTSSFKGKASEDQVKAHSEWFSIRSEDAKVSSFDEEGAPLKLTLQRSEGSILPVYEP